MILWSEGFFLHCCYLSFFSFCFTEMQSFPVLWKDLYCGTSMCFPRFSHLWSWHRWWCRQTLCILSAGLQNLSCVFFQAYRDMALLQSSPVSCAVIRWVPRWPQTWLSANVSAQMRVHFCSLFVIIESHVYSGCAFSQLYSRTCPASSIFPDINRFSAALQPDIQTLLYPQAQDTFWRISDLRNRVIRATRKSFLWHNLKYQHYWKCRCHHTGSALYDACIHMDAYVRSDYSYRQCW